MKRFLIGFLLLSSNIFPQDKIETNLTTLLNQLDKTDFSIEKRSLEKCNSILARRTPYAIIFEHTGLFEWQLLFECYHDFDVDTASYIDVDVDYKPIDDLFSLIPAFFYFESKRPYPSLNDYKNMMINVFKALGTSTTVLIDEANTKYGYSGHHYCQSFWYSGTKFAIDCYFVYVGNIACALYYMTGYSYFINSSYNIFFDLVMNLMEFKSSSGLVIPDHKPVNFSISQNYPNPFNSETTINYFLSYPGNVKLEVFNTQGESVKTLVNSYHSPGEYNLIFNADGLESGVYIYQISSAGDFKSYRMAFIK